MPPKTHRQWTGALLIATPVLFMAAFTWLQITFEYPDILRQPADVVMQKFATGGGGLVANWYLMVLAAGLFIPVAVMLQPYLARADAPYLPAATALGVTAGIVQMLGFTRWPFMVPGLAAAYLDPASSAAARAAIEVTFNALNLYAGVGIGENLGYLFTALWTVLIALAMTRSRIFSVWQGWLGIALAAGILLGTLEPVGVSFAGVVNAAAYSLWAVWLVILGLTLLMRKGAAE
jgi:hypothetical protein